MKLSKVNRGILIWVISLYFLLSLGELTEKYITEPRNIFICGFSAWFLLDLFQEFLRTIIKEK